MSPKPDAPLTKITLNLYAADVIKMRVRWGDGWSVRLRQEVQYILRDQRSPRTVEDYVTEELHND